MKVLYIGSGLSALQAKDKKYDDYVKVCANNGWRACEGRMIDYWVHSGDFPFENYPPAHLYHKRISHGDYTSVLHDQYDLIGFTPRDEKHRYEIELYIGYTIFFAGLYWIMLALKPDEIGLLGFDHDYNPAKLNKWVRDKNPAPTNNYRNTNTEKMDYTEWVKTYFAGFEPDTIYGHGTPDPMRYSKAILFSKMQLAQQIAGKLGIDLANYSDRFSPFNVFPRKVI